MTRCPTCRSPSKELHPAVQYGGEVQVCRDAWHAVCGKCGANWDGGEIPEKIRENYSPPYRWTRRINVYVQGRDGTVAYLCPDCGDEVPRT